MWQGRQEHGWFGHGTKPQDGPSSGAGGRGSAPNLGSLDQHIRALCPAAIAGLPAFKRQHPAATLDGPALDRLTGAMRAWVGGLHLDRVSFAARFCVRDPDSPAVMHLRRAAEIVAGATTDAEMREATGQLAAGMLAVGLDGWPRFLRDAHDRAQADALAQPIRSTMRRGYPYPAPANPFEVFIPGSPENEAWVRGTARALGAIGRVFNSESQGGGSAKPSSDAGKEDKEGQGSTTGVRSMPPLPANPDDLQSQGWEETSCPSAVANGRSTFVDPETGRTIEFDKANPGEPGFSGQDHYHVRNPNSTGNMRRLPGQNRPSSATRQHTFPYTAKSVRTVRMDELVERTGFHDADLTVMQMRNNRVRLQFEDVCVDVESDDLYCVTLDLGGARQVTRGGVAVNTLQTEGEGSSVIRFERSGHTASLVLAWQHYTERRSETRAYSFAFDTLDLRVEKQERTAP